MSATPFLQLYVGDYLADTLDLTTEQHGAYLLLLMTMWRHDARLPNDPAKLARIARVSPRRWHLIWESIGKFFSEEDGCIRNNRLDREYEKAVSISEKRSCSGRAGGVAKALKNKMTHLASEAVLPKHSQKSEPEEKREANASPKKKASRLSADWRLPRDWGVWAMEEGMAEAAVRIEADKFHDYWTAKAGSGAAKLDWLATWRNWVRNALRDRPQLLAGANRAVEQKTDQWGIPDAQPVRIEPRPADIDAVAPTGAADLSRVQSPEAEEDGALPFGDDDTGWAGGVLPSLRLVGGCRV